MSVPQTTKTNQQAKVTQAVTALTRLQEAYNELLTEKTYVERENSQLREELAEEREEHTITAQALEKECQEHAITAQRLELSQNQRELMEQKHRDFQIWMLQTLNNKSIPSGETTTFIALYTIFAAMRNPVTNSELQVTLQEIASKAGKSTSAVSDHIAKAEHFNLLTRRDVRPTKDSDKKETIVHITLHDAFLEPEHIDLNNKIGGVRKKKGDRYTVLHQPETGEIGLYVQPGTPKEADETIMIDDFIRKYQNRVRNALKGTDLCPNNNPNPLSPDSTEQPLNAFSTTLSVGGQTERLGHSLSMEHTIKPSAQELYDKSTSQASLGKKSPQTSTSSQEKQVAFTSIEDEIQTQRFNTATNLVVTLAGYGLELEYRSDGRHLKRVPVPTATQEDLTILKEQIAEYDSELRVLLGQKQVASDLPAQPNAQHIPLPSTASYQRNMDVQCEICKYNKAVCIWQSGKHYCQACKEKAVA